VSLVTPYYQEGVYYHGANRFLLLAALAVDRCDDTGFALDAHVAQMSLVSGYSRGQLGEARGEIISRT